MPRSRSLTKKRLSGQLSTTDNRVVSYVRASTEEQKESLEGQAKCHRDFAKARNIQIDESFPDAGVSATKTDFLDRSAVKKMLAHMQRRGISTILVLRVDRVFRSGRDFVISLIELEKRGIFLRFIDPDLDYGTPLGKMFIMQQVAMAEYEGQLRQQRMDDVYDSLRERRVARVANAIPYGWLADGKAAVIARDTGEAKVALRPYPAEQAVLHHLMAKYQVDSKHGCWTRLAREMNELAIPTKTGKSTWYPATIQSVLEHAVLAREEEICGGLPSLAAAIMMLHGDVLAGVAA